MLPYTTIAPYRGVEFGSFEAPATEAMIEHAEAELQGHFPEDFRNFLKTCNGGGPLTDHTFRVDVPIEEQDPMLDYIWGLPSDPETVGSSMLRISLILRNRTPDQGPLPSDIVFLTSRDSDWDLVMTLGPHRYGEIWIKAWELLDQEEDYDELIGQPECHFYRVASSFTEFIDSLRVAEG